ncbi:LytTR family transcriptional regulator, partial [Brevibacillus laterosporus]
MQIKLIIDENVKETEIHIHTNAYTNEIERIMRYFESSNTEVIDGYVQQQIYMLKIIDIYFVYSEGSKVYFSTDEDKYESKRK